MPSLPFVRRPRGLQFPAPTGTPITLSSTPDLTATSLNTDPSHSGIIPEIPTPTLTVTSSSSPSATPSSAAQPANALSTPAIIGLAVGVFVFLAVSLVIFMVVNNRRNRRVSGSRMNEKQIHREPKSKPQVSSPQADRANESFLSLDSTRGAFLQDRAPARPQRVVSAMTSIPNPFSISPTPSQESAHTASSHAHAQSHVIGPMALSTVNLTSYTPQYTHMPPSSVASSSISNYPDAYSEYPDTFLVNESQDVSPVEHVITRASSMVDYREVSTVNNAEYPENQARSASSKSEQNQAKVDTDPTHPPLSKADQKAARSRELKAMQNLISALDPPNSSPAAVPTSSRSLLHVDTAASTGMSRLSMGEGIVTPGGGDGDTAASSSPPGFDSFPLPPADVFRAALGLGGHCE